MTLDELVGEACTRNLTEPEVEEMCGLAEREGRSQDVLIRLLSSNTMAGRTNLSAAKTLTAQHAAKHHDRKEVKRIKREEVADRERAGKAANLPFSVTEHAFERFIERHLSEEIPGKAMEFLYDEARTAKPIKERTLSGEQQWLSQGGIFFVMRWDRNHTMPVCVTVLPRKEDKHEGRKKREGKPLGDR